jgi:hypothetical protein
MKSVQLSYGTSLKHLVTGFDWAGLGEAIVVDVRLLQNPPVLFGHRKCAKGAYRLGVQLAAPALRGFPQT